MQEHSCNSLSVWTLYALSYSKKAVEIKVILQYGTYFIEIFGIFLGTL